ncbi:hypothetical protein I5G80_gp077 [Mycobacterium phage Krueger]|uniref:Uncharacterized protein n=1 Tax=Mycobacterium phage Krueger TaxID=2015820 RepID=A0A222ZM65_9CAUD|nr:hypothetical protein I5G80_gp077 [Mycobacterium phage Krueger]ASR85568.1 hypothetical protein SEA_KRUEGER_69 [Mycobacterium phage Krueger]
MGRRSHRCSGADCGYCEVRIEQAEYARDYPADDYPDYYDGT